MSSFHSRVPARFYLLRLEARARRSYRRRARLDSTVYVDDRVDEYRSYWQGAASRLGAAFVPLSETVWEIRLGGRRARVAGYMAGPDDSATRRIAGDKLLCYRLAERVGVPVPDHCAFRLGSIDRAQEILRSGGAGFVVKPLRDTASALGITLGVRTRRQLDRAAALASLYSQDLLIERMIPGESYRLLYLNGALLHAVRRRGLRVEGDGRQSIRRLVALAHPLHGGLGDLESRTLRLQGFAPDDVPPRGASILVSGVPPGTAPSEQRTIYDEPVKDLISPGLARDAQRVVAEVGSAFAGVDIVTVDPTRPMRDSGGVLLEINTTPGIHHHYLTEDDRRRHPVAVAVLRALLAVPDSPRSGETISLAAVAGTGIARTSTHAFERY